MKEYKFKFKYLLMNFLPVNFLHSFGTYSQSIFTLILFHPITNSFYHFYPLKYDIYDKLIDNAYEK